MKKLMRKTIAFALAIVLMLPAMPSLVANAANVKTVYVPVTYNQTSARSMLKNINEFRTSSNAWEWDINNQQKIFHNNLLPLTYDYGLERIAMQKAAETAVLMRSDHKRPNLEEFHSLYSAIDYKPSYCGENMYAGSGYYSSVQSAFDGLKEEDKLYSGQGHRRNMLDNGFRYVGIGSVTVDGYTYYVQEFASTPSGYGIIPANDSEQAVGMEIDTSLITSISSSKTSYTINCGDYETIKDDITIGVNGRFPQKGIRISSVYGIIIADETIASVSGNKIFAHKPGHTIGIVFLGSKSFEISITVTGSCTTSPNNIGIGNNNSGTNQYIQTQDSIVKLNKTNLPLTSMTAIFGATVTNQAEGSRPKILSFVRTNGNCSLSNTMINNLSSLDLAKVDVIIIDADNAGKDVVKRSQEMYCNNKNIQFAYGASGNPLMWQYVSMVMEKLKPITFPVVVYIDSNNKVQKVDVSTSNKATIEATCEQIFGIDVRPGRSNTASTSTPSTSVNVPTYNNQDFSNSNITKDVDTNVSKSEKNENESFIQNPSEEKKTVLIRFNAQGGICDALALRIPYMSTIDRLPDVSRTGYRFKGWFLKPEGGVQVVGGAAYDHDITLYAQWIKE